ncbi:Solute carrier organic anion transporter member [Mactra antiquata]
MVTTINRKTPMCNIKQDTGDGINYAVLHSNTSVCDIQGAETSYGVGEPNEYTNIAIGPIAIGIISGVGIFGPAVAFGVGGVFSRQYVTLEEVPITPRHPAWIGAWWLGFVIFGIIAIITSFPILLFPRKLRPRPHTFKPPKTGSYRKAALEFFKVFGRLLTNTVYMPLVLSNCIALFVIAGNLAFSAKYLETQFFIPAWKANMLLGVTNVVAASTGTVVGGFIVTKRKLSPLACLRMMLVIGFLGVLFNVFGYVFGCSNADIVGYNVESPIDVNNNTCTETCGCDSRAYFPICGSDNNNYMSPCHAGCTERSGMMFKNCTCTGNMVATPGLCETSCKMLYPHLVNSILAAFLATLGTMPGFIVMLR